MPGRLAWVYVFILGYLAQAIQNVVNMLYLRRARLPVLRAADAPTLIHVGPPPFSLETWNNAWSIFVMAILPIGVYLLCRALPRRRASATRRSIGPILAHGARSSRARRGSTATRS